MSTIYYKVKENGIERIQSLSYAELKEYLAHHLGIVGVEVNSDGLLHYYYQSDAETSEIRRYPLRKIREQYICLNMYQLLKIGKEELILGAVSAPAPELPKDSLFFIEQDKSTINAMKQAAREERLKPSKKAPYFPELPLTQKQQESLYSGQVKTHISFQEELNKLLENSEISPEEKESALRTCISKQSEKLSDCAAVQSMVIQSEFLSLGSIVNYPASIVDTKEMAGQRTSLPTIGAIRDYYVACIQSHLQYPVAAENISGQGDAKFLLAKTIKLGEKPATSIIEAPTYKPLSKKEEDCLIALNVILLSRQEKNKSENLKILIIHNEKLLNVAEELFTMISDLKNVADKKTETTKHTEYEMIYREFFAILVASEEVRDLSQLTSLTPAYLALKELHPFIRLNKLASLYKNAEADKREDILKQLKAAQKDTENPDSYLGVSWILFSHNLMSPEEKASLFLECVQKGNQEFALWMVRKSPELLTMEGTATDYSGRTFKNCTAYEYAYWAMDTHMRKMLEAHMNDDAKAQLLKRIDYIENEGLSYQQPTWDAATSTFQPHHFQTQHFDMTPLITALQEYLNGYGQWEREGNCIAMQAAWMKIGLAQRDVPAHVAQEYCRGDRTFNPLPSFNEDVLPRTCTFKNHFTPSHKASTLAIFP